MKKIHLYPLTTSLLMLISTTTASANVPTFVSSVTGSGPTTTSIEMGARADVYRHNQDNENTNEEYSNQNDYDAMIAVNNEKNEVDFKMYAYSENGSTTITSITTQNDRVSMTRTIPVKLFWFFPFTISETATIISFGNDQNRVTVTRPRWSFFSKGEYAKEDIVIDIEERIKNIPSGQFVSLLSTSTKTTLLLKIRESFILTASSSLTNK